MAAGRIQLHAACIVSSCEAAGPRPPARPPRPPAPGPAINLAACLRRALLACRSELRRRTVPHVYASPLPRPPPIPPRWGKHRREPLDRVRGSDCTPWCHLRNRRPSPRPIRPAPCPRSCRAGADTGTSPRLRRGVLSCGAGGAPAALSAATERPLHHSAAARASFVGAACGAMLTTRRTIRLRSASIPSSQCNKHQCEPCGSGAGYGLRTEAPPATSFAVAERPPYPGRGPAPPRRRAARGTAASSHALSDPRPPPVPSRQASTEGSPTVRALDSDWRPRLLGGSVAVAAPAHAMTEPSVLIV